MGNLYLIGVHHFDLKGPQRLRKLLNHIRPSAICLESDSRLVAEAVAGWENFSGAEKAGMLDTEIDRIYCSMGITRPVSDYTLAREFIRTACYEIWISEEYRRHTFQSMAMVPVLREDLILKHIKPVYEASIGPGMVSGRGEFTPRFWEMLAGMTYQKFQREQERKYSASPKPSLKKREILSILHELDDEMEPRIRRAAKNSRGLPVAVPVGFNHLFMDYGNLANRLSDLSPTRIKLNQADKLA